MADLTPESVRALVAALGITASEEDLVEIGHRVNGALDALGALATLPLDSVEPWPMPPDPDRDGS